MTMTIINFQEKRTNLFPKYLEWVDLHKKIVEQLLKKVERFDQPNLEKWNRLTL